MTNHNKSVSKKVRSALLGVIALAALAITACTAGGAGNGAPAQCPDKPASEVDLCVPDLSAVTLNGINGYTLLLIGVVICLAGFAFGLVSYLQLKKQPVHQSMKEISELIYETCKAYLVKQGKFLLILFAFIGAIIAVYFGFLTDTGWGRVVIVLLFSVIGMAGSYGIAWYGIRLNTFANSRTAHASLPGKPYPVSVIPLRSGMSIGMVLISTELIMMLFILLALPGNIAGSCFIGFAIGESLGASALRIAGGIFTKIADVGSDLMKIVFKIGEDDPRNPGTIADCTGDNAGDSVGPSADGFETYGVTGVALVSFILLAVHGHELQGQLLVWIFFIRAIMLVASGLSYAVNTLISNSKFANSDEMEFETPLTSLVWITSVVSIVLTFVASYLLIPDLGGNTALWWQLSLIISFGTLAGALIPELVKVFTGVKAKHVEEVVKSAKEGGASLDILSGLVAGNFSAYWIGLAIIALMGGSYLVSTGIDATLMLAPSVFALGLVAFGFLGMGPVTIAVDSYGPVTDNAQSVYELSRIESVPNIEKELKDEFGIEPKFAQAKHLLEAGDGAGNTFKATAKPVLIGTAAVGATTMIFSIIIALTHELAPEYMEKLSLLHTPFLLGLLAGGAIIYWFSGASMQAVTTGAFRAVEYIKGHIHLDTSSEKASVEDSRRVVEICTEYAQNGMFNIFLGIFFATLSFAFLEPFFFVGYLISIAIFGLYQAIFMANAGGAWDNAKKIVEVDLDAKGTELHDASIVGDTVGDPFKDTSSVALNPVIKFTTLFGMLAVTLAESLRASANGDIITITLSAVFFVASVYMAWRSFYKMRIDQPMLTKEDMANEPRLVTE
ncbi:MAG: sodium-translocating pyrophosphatase [Propionibacteriaceae bacterium]|nr:sodium-translocating pyrophosphatase [Propionibacteriaceae bacterium]